MNRAQLEHVIRAAATIAEDDEIIIVGSHAILGQYPDAPDELLVSTDVDLYPRHRPERADLIDGSIGELSPFHATFGYYAQGVGERTAILPDGWQDRLVAVSSPPGTGLCLEAHDLVISKYVASRPKDRDYVRAAIRHRLVGRDVLLARLTLTDLPEEERTRLTRLIEADCASVG